MIIWTEKKSNKRVVNEKRELISTTEKRKAKFIGHTLCVQQILLKYIGAKRCREDSKGKTEEVVDL